MVIMDVDLTGIIWEYYMGIIWELYIYICISNVVYCCEKEDHESKRVMRRRCHET